MAKRSLSLSREEIEVHSFSWVATVFVPLIAIFLQVTIPRKFPFFAIFDLPLLVTIFFAVARRNPMIGSLTGAAIGIVQDAFTQNPIGIFGIAKTVVGYLASSIGVKVDVENPGSRILMTFGFYLLHQAVYYLVGRNMARLPLPGFQWAHELGAALANALLAVVLFVILDKTKSRKR
jgi:rod shape-determining protein MreD